jgi:hypothetical protein
MHPETMKHKASLWDGEFGISGHITDVHWEGDITREELTDVADQVTSDWQTIDLELDPAHPCHDKIYRLYKLIPDLNAATSESQKLQAEVELAGQYVWVHCCKHVFDPLGDLQDEHGQTYHQVFNTVMFCTEFVSFDDIAQQCDDSFGADAWNEYELFLNDDLPTPVATYG